MGKTKGEERIGEKRVMKCGIECTIVAYHSSTNIDVLFDTGELICGKRYSHFLEGSISNKGGQAVNHRKTEADRKKRLGEKKMMNCGLEGEITEYFNRNNITVTLSDGCIMKDRTYQQFLQGGICSENADSQWFNHRLQKECKEKYVGQALMMKCGLKATVKDYINSSNIVVEFENGTIVENVAIDNFKRGEILPYDRNRSDEYVPRKNIINFVSIKNNQINEQRVNDSKNKNKVKTEKKSKKRGDLKSKKKADKEVVLIDKTRENKKSLEAKNYLKKESLKDKTIDNKKKQIGYRRKMLDGHLCELIKFNCDGSVNVKYDDGVVLENKPYDAMLRGTIKKPVNRIGELNVMNNGQTAKLIKYNEWRDVDIEYEDGTVVKHIEYKHFKDGSAVNPNCKIHTVTSLQEFSLLYYLRNYGFEKIPSGKWKDDGFGNYELDFYNKEKRIAIEYDGGFHDTVDVIEREKIKNLKCKEFNILLYRFRSPKLKNRCDENSFNYILDKNKRVKNDVIDCKKEIEEIFIKHDIAFNEDDIDFQRDIDKIIKEYQSTHINKHARERVGEKVYNIREEQEMEIIEYFDCKHMTVRFESGEIVHNVQYKQFHRGTLLKPKRKNIA